MILARRISAAHAVLAAILAIALWLRVFGPTMHGFDWGQGNFQHPDENYIGGLVGGLGYPSSPLDLFNRNSSWNPAAVPNLAGVANGSLPHTGFNYGSLPLYLIKIFSSILSWLGAHFSIFGSWRHANPILAGRVLSGAFDTITVALVFLLGRRLADERAGLFAAALASFAVLSIQLAHFTTVDSFLGTFSTGTVLAGVTLFQEGRARDYVMLGIWLAAACATKASAAPLVAIAGMAVLWRQQELGRLRSWETVRRSALLAVTALVALFVFQPYMFVDWSDFSADLSSQNDLATGRVLTFYTIRWHGVTPLLSPLSQLTNCSLGIPLALLGYAGLAWQTIRMSAGKWLRGTIAGATAGLALILCGILAAARFPLSTVKCSIGSLHVDTIVLTGVEILAPLLCLIVSLLLPRRSGAAIVAFFVLTYFLAAETAVHGVPALHGANRSLALRVGGPARAGHGRRPFQDRLPGTVPAVLGCACRSPRRSRHRPAPRSGDGQPEHFAQSSKGGSHRLMVASAARALATRRQLRTRRRRVVAHGMLCSRLPGHLCPATHSEPGCMLDVPACIRQRTSYAGFSRRAPARWRLQRLRQRARVYVSHPPGLRSRWPDRLSRRHSWQDSTACSMAIPGTVLHHQQRARYFYLLE